MSAVTSANRFYPVEGSTCRQDAAKAVYAAQPAAHSAATSPRCWRSKAACLDEPLDLFFPTAATGPMYAAEVAAAKAVCRRCPVVEACLSDALVHAPYGIAGGLTEAERSTARTARCAIVPPGAVEQDLDPVMVDRVARSGRQPGATREELAAAAVRLVEGGQSIVRVAERLGLSERTVSIYAATARATQSVAS